VDVPAGFSLPWRPLRLPRRTTGRERRWLDPERGLLKRGERIIDRLTARYVFPHLLGVWHPSCWRSLGFDRKVHLVALIVDV
jgi:hypothetical protein